MYGFQEIDAVTLEQWRDDGAAVKLIDVRSVAEMNRGMIPGSEPVPMHLIPVVPIEVREGEKLVICCRSGARSAQVCAFLGQRGITDIYNLRGGIIGWVSAGLPLVAPDSGKVAG